MFPHRNIHKYIWTSPYGKTHNHIEISNRFAALESLSDDEDINRAWENIKRNTKPQLKRV